MKTRTFSIYLLKSGVTVANALREEHILKAREAAGALPPEATLLVLDNTPKSPWWRAFFDIENPLLQVTKGALVFVPVSGRTVALSFGHVAHWLKEESYEHDFGIRVTLNSVDPNKLKSTDAFEPDSARRSRVQIANAADLTLFDFNRDSKILKSLTGQVRADRRFLFKNPTGASNLRISTPATSAELVSLCEQLIEVYNEDTYKTAFPNLHGITPIRDPTIISELDNTLVLAMKEGSGNLGLAIPDIVNYDDSVAIWFTGEGRSLLYSEVDIDNYFDYLDSRKFDFSVFTVETLKKHRMVLVNEAEQEKISHSIYNSVVYDVTLSNTLYHMVDGNWYSVEESYRKKLEDFLDPLCVDIPLVDYTHNNEGAYNNGNASNEMLCLDEKNISLPGESQIEPCDLYSVEGGRSVFWHVKISTLSDKLSHLFNQGANAVEFLKLEPVGRQNLVTLINASPSTSKIALIDPVDKLSFKVVFVIISKKDKAGKSSNLPIFSRISLARVMRSLQVMSVERAFGFVADKSPAKPGKKKTVKKKAA